MLAGLTGGQFFPKSAANIAFPASQSIMIVNNWFLTSTHSATQNPISLCTPVEKLNLFSIIFTWFVIS